MTNKNIKELTNYWKVKILDRKKPSRNIIKRTAHSDPSMSSGSDDNRYSIFEEEDENTDNEDYESVDAILLIDKKKPAFSYNVEDFGQEGINEIICKCNMKHPEDFSNAGKWIEYAHALEEEFKEKEYEIEYQKSPVCSVEALHFITQNEVAYEANESTKNYAALKAKHDKRCDMLINAVQEYWEEKV